MGEQILRVNLDETSLKLNYDGIKGVVMADCLKEVVLVPAKSAQRGALSHVMMVCDDSGVQPLLPQVILGNKHILRVQDLDVLKDELPSNVYVIRGTSSWILAETMIVIMEMLRQALSSNHIDRRVVLILDACPVHMHRRVWSASKRLGICLCFVPAGLTWFVQPLDVIVIRRFKAFLRREYQEVQLQQTACDVSVITVLRIIVRAIREVLQGNCWDKAFSQCGYDVDERHIKHGIRALMNKARDSSLSTPMGMPSEQDLTRIFPRRHQYDTANLLWHMHHDVHQVPIHGVQHAQVRRTPTSSCGVGHHETHMTMSVEPWSQRLRPRSSMELDAHHDRSRSPPRSSQGGASSSRDPAPCQWLMPAMQSEAPSAPGRSRGMMLRAVALARPRKPHR